MKVIIKEKGCDNWDHLNFIDCKRPIHKPHFIAVLAKAICSRGFDVLRQTNFEHQFSRPNCWGVANLKEEDRTSLLNMVIQLCEHYEREYTIED